MTCRKDREKKVYLEKKNNKGTYADDFLWILD